MKSHVTAGELANKALQNSTDYNCLEIGHALTEDIGKSLRDCIENHKNIILEPEFCVVRVFCTYGLIKNAYEWKYYAWPFLPSPRPSQNVFLYSRSKDDIVKRLWSLPNALAMSKLACDTGCVPDSYKEMQAWSIAFYNGTFWDYIRWEHKIDLLSEQESLLKHRQELIDLGCQPVPISCREPFDFSKITTNKVINPFNSIIT